MLYKVYLVDDEELALKNLESRVPWNEYGFEVAGRNINPVEALREIGSIRPNVVITDMKMPGMDGLTLIGKVREISPQTQFLVVSAHSDYSLMRGSIKAGTFDYLLKPVSPDGSDSVLKQLVQRLDSIYPSGRPFPEGGYNRVFKEILLYIEEHIEQRISLTELADIFHVGVSTLCHYFKKYMDTTFVNHLTEIRMRRAREFIASDMSIKEIASHCGYDDYFYFFRVFQGYFGCTPTQMKEKILYGK